MNVGILDLQGAVGPHAEKLRGLGVNPVFVKRTSDLAELSGIVLPGGESTTMIHLLKLNDLWDSLNDFVRVKPSWGICAGSILLAKKVSHPNQASLGAMNIGVERNAYGRQVDSFITALTPTADWTGAAVEGVFIRAPVITEKAATVRTLLTHENKDVLVEEDHLLASTFHPELSESRVVHEYFINKCRG